MKKRFLSILLLVVSVVLLTVAFSPTQAQPPFLTGQWLATFYNNTAFSGSPVATNISYTTLNINWQGQPTQANGQPILNVPADGYSVVFSKGPVTFNAGTFRYTMQSSESASLTVNGTAVIPSTTPNVPQSADIQLSAPTSVNLEVRFVNTTGPGILILTEPATGGTPGQPPFAPTAVPTATPLPTITPLPPIPPGAITATVIRAGILNTRDAPSLGGNRIGRILRGETYAIVGRNTDTNWFLLQLAGYQGWAYGYYLFIDGNEFTPPIVSGNSVLGLAGQPDFGVRGQTSATLRLRAGPSVATTQTGRITWGAFIPIVGRTADGFWYKVVWKNTVGWAYAPFIDILEGDINAVPVGT